MTDVTITITAGTNSVAKIIPGAKLTEFRSGFLTNKPVPTIPDPNWVDSEDGTPHPQVNEYTDLEWFAEVLEQGYRLIYNRGKSQLAQEAKVLDPDIIVDA